jgi:hypothetical protein
MTGLQGELRDRIVGSAAHVYVFKVGGIQDPAAEVARVLAASDDYAVLGLPPGGGAGGAGGLRARYRALAISLHPDKCAHPDASSAFQRLVAAYGVLQKHVR